MPQKLIDLLLVLLEEGVTLSCITDLHAETIFRKKGTGDVEGEVAFQGKIALGGNLWEAFAMQPIGL